MTGHTIPTVELTADEVMKRFYHFDDEVDEKESSYYLTIVAKDHAHIELFADVRHGTNGFRANRYESLDQANQKRRWDEWPMFFETLDQAIELFAHSVETTTYLDGKKPHASGFNPPKPTPLPHRSGVHNVRLTKPKTPNPTPNRTTSPP